MEKRLYIKALLSQFNFSMGSRRKYSDKIISESSSFDKTYASNRFRNIFVIFVDYLDVFFALGQLKRFLHQFSCSCGEGSNSIKDFTAFICCFCRTVAGDLCLISCDYTW